MSDLPTFGKPAAEANLILTELYWNAWREETSIENGTGRGDGMPAPRFEDQTATDWLWGAVLTVKEEAAEAEQLDHWQALTIKDAIAKGLSQ